MATFAKDCLAGKAILITGGLGAIGQVVVGRLLGHSASVTVNDIVEEGRAQQIIRERAWSSDHLAYARADVTRPEEVEGLVSRALGAFGRLDIALCHAGMAFSSPILDYSESDWQKIMDVNLKSAFLVARASARAMTERDIKGKIIFTSSWVQDVPWPDITPYTSWPRRAYASILSRRGLSPSAWPSASGTPNRITAGAPRKPSRWATCSRPNPLPMP